MNYQIITDSCCDLPGTLPQELGLLVAPLTVHFRGQEIQDFKDDTLKELFDAFRSGESATTAAANPAQWSEIIEPVLAQGRDVLVLAFSSGLSTTYQSAVIAGQELEEKYPERRVRVVDTRAASLGQGLLVWYACRKRDEGMDLDSLTAWCEESRFHLCHWFTVDDLMYLKRGGRIGAGTALVGTMLGIKPVLHMDDAGHLINMGKVRGRKASLDALIQKMEQLGAGYDNSTVFICHGDCIGDARYVESVLKEKFGVKTVLIGYVGAVIGSHSGPGTLALFFMGQHR